MYVRQRSLQLEKLSYLPISSMKIMHGWIFSANVNIALASLGLSPYHLSMRVEISRLIKLTLASLAVALAMRVLPQPGGP